MEYLYYIFHILDNEAKSLNFNKNLQAYLIIKRDSSEILKTFEMGFRALSFKVV